MSNDEKSIHRTEQERFWAGEFGDGYIARNDSPELLASNVVLFERILADTADIGSVLEFGANVGMNLLGLRRLLPRAHLAAVEINLHACAELEKNLPDCTVYPTSILTSEITAPADLVLVKGVLIHQDPADLEAVYDRLAAATRRYLVICEYYNPVPVEIDYRGHAGKLFKRDFAGEFLDRHEGFTLLDYGFAWRRDPVAPQDDLTWFLLEKAE